MNVGRPGEQIIMRFLHCISPDFQLLLGADDISDDRFDFIVQRADKRKYLLHHRVVLALGIRVLVQQIDDLIGQRGISRAIVDHVAGYARC